MTIKALGYEVRDLGKTIKKSKRHFIWKFEIEGKPHRAEIVVSYMSGKKKVVVDGSTLYEGQKVLTTAFQFPFNVDSGNMCNIVQHGENFELRINNQVFSHLWDSEKMKKEFTYDSSVYGDSYNKADADSYASKKYEGYGGTSAGGTGSYQSSQKRETSSRVTGGWGDVQNAMKSLKVVDEFSKPKNETKGDSWGKSDEGGFDHGFDKFDYKAGKSQTMSSSQPKEMTSKKDAGFTDFSNFGTTEQKKTGGSDFTDFSNWGKGDSKPKPTTTTNPKPSTSGFTDFSNMGKSQPSGQTATTQPKKQQTSNLLDFDDGPTETTTQQPQKSGGGGGLEFGDAFLEKAFVVATNINANLANTSQPIQQEPFGFNSNPTVTSNGNNLGGFDFGGPTTTTTTNNGFTSNTSATTNNTNTVTATNKTSTGGFDFFDDGPTTTTTQQTTTQPQTTQFQNQQPIQQTTQQPPTKKADTWSSNLVDLNDLKPETNQSTTGGNFGTNSYGGNPSGGFNMGGYGGNTGSFGGNQGGFGGNQSGFGGNQGGFGGSQGGNFGGYGGNQSGFGGNQGGFGGQPQGGFGGTTGGFGTTQGGFGGMGESQGGFGGQPQGGFGGTTGGYGGNQGGFGGYGGTQGGFGGSQGGFGGNQGGFGGQPQGGFGGSQGGFGGTQGGYGGGMGGGYGMTNDGGFGQSTGGVQGGFGGSQGGYGGNTGGFNMNTNVQTTTTTSVKTPFDF